MRQTLDKDGIEFITLEAFMKSQGLADTGGQAKMLIKDGEVQVNGMVETRRGRKLRQDDTVYVEGEEENMIVAFDAE